VRTHLHVLTRLDPIALETVRGQRDAGLAVRCLLIHDAVYSAGAAGVDAWGAVDCAAADRRRRGLSVGDGDLEPAQIVAAMVEADSVTAW
jgi:hypothetical protein